MSKNHTLLCLLNVSFSEAVHLAKDQQVQFGCQ